MSQQHRESSLWYTTIPSGWSAIQQAAAYYAVWDKIIIIGGMGHFIHSVQVNTSPFKPKVVFQHYSLSFTLNSWLPAPSSTEKSMRPHQARHEKTKNYVLSNFWYKIIMVNNVMLGFQRVTYLHNLWAPKPWYWTIMAATVMTRWKNHLHRSMADHALDISYYWQKKK